MSTYADYIPSSATRDWPPEAQASTGHVLSRLVTALGPWLWLLIPVFLVSGAVTTVANSVSFYSYEFQKNSIPERTGIALEQLRRGNYALIQYFNRPGGTAEITIERGGVPFSLFDPREVAHLKDVKTLIQRVYWVADLSAVLILGYLILGLTVQGRRFLRPLASNALWGAVATVGGLLAIGLMILVAFDQLFLLFHYISFDNDLWILDPSSEFLLMMYPDTFFMEGALFVAGLAIAGGALIGAASGAYLWRQRQRKQAVARWAQESWTVPVEEEEAGMAGASAWAGVALVVVALFTLWEIWRWTRRR